MEWPVPESSVCCEGRRSGGLTLDPEIGGSRIECVASGPLPNVY